MGASLSEAETCSLRNVKCAWFAEERGVVDRAQVDQQLGTPAARVVLENLLMELAEAQEALDLNAERALPAERPMR